MCELLGICFNNNVNIALSLRGFKHRGEYHPNGWGIAFYPDGFVRLIKEPIKMNDGILTKYVKWANLESKIFLTHIRKASAGRESYVNTHPFVRKLENREITFAHNGTLYDYEELELGEYQPIGETDSEHAFCYLLSQIKERNIPYWKGEFNDILNIFMEINKYGAFNCLLSDGEYLFAYRGVDSLNGTRDLYFLKREPPYEIIKMEDDDYNINLGNVKNCSEEGFIIATIH